MCPERFFSVNVEPDWQGLLACIRRTAVPSRVHFIELFLDEEVKESLCQRFDLVDGLDRSDPFFGLAREIRIQRFLGYDYVRCGVDDVGIKIDRVTAADTASLARSGGRAYVDEHRGPIANWADFERFPWPDPERITTRNLEWYQKNLPGDMCIIGSGGFAHFAEYLTWMFGYEPFCYALFEQRDLVEAISRRLIEIYQVVVRKMLAFDRVKIVWGSDDLGFRGGTLISPADLRAFVLPGHRAMAAASHAAGRPYLLHSCGKLDAIMPALLDDVQIDGLHSYEDTIRTIEETQAKYGDRMAVLGGIDVDFLCRADESAIRRRVRATVETCQPRGGFCLGTGNSVANYVPIDHYLAMLDEGRRFGK